MRVPGREAWYSLGYRNAPGYRSPVIQDSHTAALIDSIFSFTVTEPNGTDLEE